jgi:hypothetical protein
MFNVFEKILLLDRRLRIENKKLIQSQYYNEKLSSIVMSYFNDFSNYFELSPYDIIEKYYDFQKTYIEDLKLFLLTNKYPIELGIKRSINRLEYDITLILSILLSIHRHRIFSNYLHHQYRNKIAICGLGSGVELEVLNKLKGNFIIDAYDLNISDFIKERFLDSKLIESEFPNSKKLYDQIISIELLEHLSEPFRLLSKFRNYLLKNGELIITIAINLPQFDHYYNFCIDIFERKISELELSIKNKDVIPHKYLVNKSETSNVWYVLNHSVN